MTTASGGFSSPNYPLPYHPSAECYWNIRTSQGSQLLLSFSDFHLESSSTCSFDYLAVSIVYHSVYNMYFVRLILAVQKTQTLKNNCWDIYYLKGLLVSSENDNSCFCSMYVEALEALICAMVQHLKNLLHINQYYINKTSVLSI